MILQNTKIDMLPQNAFNHFSEHSPLLVLHHPSTRWVSPPPSAVCPRDDT